MILHRATANIMDGWVNSLRYIGHLAIVLWPLWLLYIKWWYCTWPIALAPCCCFLFVVFVPLLYDNIICGQFIFLLGRPGQSVNCKASLAALRLYGYFCDFCFMLVSENKYDDDDDEETNWCQDNSPRRVRRTKTTLTATVRQYNERY